MIKYSTNKKNRYFSFDQTIHAVLAEFNQISNPSQSSLQTLISLLKKNWINAGYDNAEEENYFKVRAYLMLTTYFNNPLDCGLESIIINKMLSKNISKNFVIFRRIDKLYERYDGNFEFIDYKTGKRIMHSKNFELDNQSVLSLALIKDKVGIYPDSISYYYLSYGRKFTHFITFKDIRFIERSISCL